MVFAERLVDDGAGGAVPIFDGVSLTLLSVFFGLFYKPGRERLVDDAGGGAAIRSERARNNGNRV